jgi:CBS domain-containing protein
VTDSSNRLIGVITDRDIVCRVVAKGKNPSAVTAAECMSEPVVVVNEETKLEDVLAVMEENQIRRVPVVDGSGCCCGIISQADVALCAHENKVGELVREVSKDTLSATH